MWYTKKKVTDFLETSYGAMLQMKEYNLGTYSSQESTELSLDNFHIYTDASACMSRCDQDIPLQEMNSSLFFGDSHLLEAQKRNSKFHPLCWLMVRTPKNVSEQGQNKILLIILHLLKGWELY